MNILLPFLIATTVSIFWKSEYNTKHDWELIDGKYWRAISELDIEPKKTYSKKCPAGMVEINGEMKQDPNPGLFSGNNIDALQKRTCIHWLNREPHWRDRCKHYDRDKWLKLSSTFETKHMHFCIDAYESNNKAGQYPMVMITYYEAESICKAHDKRLCSEFEWTFACEGEEAMPYPYGYSRDETICVIDKSWIAYSSDLFPRGTIDSMKEMDKLWQGEPSGSRTKCKSIFEVYDLTSNVDEITTAVIIQNKSNKLALKGGYWSGVRNRCRATTRSHDESFAFYQVSFRCCKDIN